jgi:formate dehydrogenase maturation protein FdhE
MTEVQIAWCPVCGGGDFAKVIRGLETNPINYLKCTQCGREFPEPKPCDGEACKI